MTFTTRRLVGSRVLVTGTDVLGTDGKAILDSKQWDDIKADSDFSQATEAFDSAVAAFFAPLTEAAEKASKLLDNKPEDSASYVVLSEAVEGVQAQPAQLIKLTHDSVVLRLIEQGDTSRLLWVGDDKIEVLEVAAAPAPVPSSGLPTDAGLS